MLKTIFGYFSSKRSLEAAGGGRRWANAPVMRDARSSILSGAGTVSVRAQSYVLNNAHGARAVNALAGAIVGAGITPRSQHDAEAVRRRLARDFSAWGDEADADGRLDVYGLQDAVARDLITFGEALAVFGADERTMAPRVRRLHPEQLDRSRTQLLPDGSIVQGVEFDSMGRRRAYWILPTAPGDSLTMGSLKPERYAAAQVMHVYRPLVPGQARGLSWFAPVLLPASTLDQLMDAMLVRAKVAAMFVGSIVDADGTGAGYEGTQTGQELDVSIEPGAIRVEQPGKELKWNEPPLAGDAPKLATETLRMIATGVGCTYEQLTGDYSMVNYSSARAGILEFRRFIEMVQHHVIVHQFCRPIWQRFIQFEVLRGAIGATAYQSDRYAFEAVKWLPPAWPSIDPSRDASAAETNLKLNITSRSALVAEAGYAIEDLDAEIAADKARAKQLGIAPEVIQ